MHLPANQLFTRSGLAPNGFTSIRSHVLLPDDLARQLYQWILDDLGLIEALHSECANSSQRESVELEY